MEHDYSTSDKPTPIKADGSSDSLSKKLFDDAQSDGKFDCFKPTPGKCDALPDLQIDCKPEDPKDQDEKPKEEDDDDEIDDGKKPRTDGQKDPAIKDKFPGNDPPESPAQGKDPGPGGDTGGGSLNPDKNKTAG